LQARFANNPMKRRSYVMIAMVLAGFSVALFVLPHHRTRPPKF
jgi:hypothetical protein